MRGGKPPDSPFAINPTFATAARGSCERTAGPVAVCISTTSCRYWEMSMMRDRPRSLPSAVALSLRM